MFELYINDMLMDIPTEVGDEIVLEYSALTVDDIDKRSSNKSFTFNLPKTAVNLTACRNSQQVDNLTRFPYTRLKARAFQDGVDLKIRFAQVNSISETIEIILFGSNADFFQLLGDLEIKDLDFTGQNHFWDFFTIVQNHVVNTADTVKKYIYPLIDYHEDSPNTLINNADNDIWVKGMFPSLFYRDLLQKVVTEQGYTLLNAIDTDPDYKDAELLFPYSGTEFKRDENGSRYEIKVGRQTDLDTSTVAGSTTYTFVEWDYLAKETEYFKRVYDNWTANIFPHTFKGIALADRCKLSGSYKLILKNDSAFDAPMTIRISAKNFFADRNSTNIKEVTTVVFANTTKVISGTFTELITGEDFNGTQFDSLLCELEFDRTSIDLFVLAGSELVIDKAEIIEAREILYDVNPDFSQHSQNYLTLGSIYSSFKQIDIIANYCKLFCLAIDVDNDKKIVTLYKYDSIRDNLHNAKDWTDKVDLTTDYQLEYLDNNYGRKNNLLYQIDKQPLYIQANAESSTDTGLEADEKPISTQGVINIDNENLELEKDVVQLDFGATVAVKRMPDYTTNQIPVIKDGKIANAKTQRILFAARVFNAPNAIDIEDGVNLVSSNNFVLTWFIGDRKPYNLGFDNDLMPKNYTNLINILRNYKLLRIYLRLNVADINQLDFKKPVFLQQFDSYFAVNKIVDYSPTKNDSTQVELLKLNIAGQETLSLLDEPISQPSP